MGRNCVCESDLERSVKKKKKNENQKATLAVYEGVVE